MTRRGFTAICAATLCLALAALAPRGAAAQTLADVVRASQITHANQLPSTDQTPHAARIPQAPQGGDLFGSTEFRSGSLNGLPQWTRVLATMKHESALFEGCAENEAKCTTPALKNWRRIIVAAAKLPRAARPKAVNDFFNRWPYKQDREIYGRREYWATPSEFLSRSGDCEDYSIAKYFALRQLGFTKDELRVVILMDQIRGIGHAVLAVYDQDDILILDSLSNLIVSHARYRHYVPQYSMNETTRWAHVGSFQRDSKPVYRGLLARK